MQQKSNILVYDTADQAAQAVAERFAQHAAADIREHRSFAVALAGGTTPRRAYELLGSDEYRKRIDWRNVHLFFGDERLVRADSPDSNYRMINEALISRVAIPEKNVHRIITEKNATTAAENYEAELRSFFGKREWPRFDLILLGMGEDGHTASLFPGSAALKEQTRWVVSTQRPKPRQKRVTLTLPVINHAARIFFMVTGKEKAGRILEVLESPDERKTLPAQLVQPQNGYCCWLLDQAAASRL